SEEARSAPPWVVGYTDGVSSVVVLLPARTPTYPDGALADVLRHEVAHVLISRAAAGHAVPRWFNEGVAMMAGRTWGLRDYSELALEPFHGKRVPVYRLDALFAGDRDAVRRAYALSGAFVKSLVERHGSGLPRALFSRLARGVPFEVAFREVTGRTLDEAGEGFFREQTVFRRWIPILTSSAFAWFAISILALLAIRKRRALDRARRADWETREPEEPYEFVDESELDSPDSRPPS
ncbi:MAG TPA: hypothetical protein VGR00_00465, partial [Thermoanaerobaculia bacterium]|nr:hypothetical protein [Thermoanaerobaculia bacterium]